MNKPLAIIIEDDYDLSVFFNKALRAANFETQVAQAGDVAMQWLSTVTPEVIVLDLHLPQVVGMDILKWIRAEERLAKTRVIVTTADARLAETLHDQADLVLVKPVSFSQLRDMALRLHNL